MGRCILALDTGGTKCQSLLLDESGNVLGSGYRAGKSLVAENIDGGSGRAAETILGAAHDALAGAEFDSLFVVNTKSGKYDLCDKPAEFRHFDEAGSALALAGEDTGVVVLAGTGALVCGKTALETLYMDGLGPILGDYGSASHVGYMALRAAARSGWHPRHHTTLGNLVRQQVAEYKEGSDPRGTSLIQFSLSNFDRADIAGLSRLVTAEATAGDAISIGILREAAASLAVTVSDVVDRLYMAGGNFALVGTGGLLTHSPLYWDMLRDEVRKFAPNCRPIISDLPPVVGLGVRALRLLFADDYEARADNLRRQARETYL